MNLYFIENASKWPVTYLGDSQHFHVSSLVALPNADHFSKIICLRQSVQKLKQFADYIIGVSLCAMTSNVVFAMNLVERVVVIVIIPVQVVLPVSSPD